MAETGVFGGLAAIADPLRGRIVLALERHELAVAELSAVFQLPQSTMSRHLKALSEEGWLVARVEGSSRLYSLPRGRLDPALARVWRVVREEVARLAGAELDDERIERVLDERRARSRAFFAGAAGDWDRMRRDLVGRRADAQALLALVDDGWVVGDLGCGTGQVAELLAPYVARVVAVDDSDAMLMAARARLSKCGNVEVKRGTLERLPIDDGALDAAVIMLALPYVADPGLVIGEAVRSLRAGGRLLVADLTAHDREEYRQRFGHRALGFEERQVREWLGGAGAERVRYTVVPADPESKGPPMFVATAVAGGR